MHRRCMLFFFFSLPRTFHLFPSKCILFSTFLSAVNFCFSIISSMCTEWTLFYLACLKKKDIIFFLVVKCFSVLWVDIRSARIYLISNVPNICCQTTFSFLFFYCSAQLIRNPFLQLVLQLSNILNCAMFLLGALCLQSGNVNLGLKDYKSRTWSFVD